MDFNVLSLGEVKEMAAAGDKTELRLNYEGVEDSFTSTNSARNEICACLKDAWFGPQRWQWYTYNWCPHCGRKLSPIA